MAPRREIALLEDQQRITALGVIAPPPIQVESPVFNGSLATLFQCVKARKLDLLDVPLAPICEAYFTYILQTVVNDLDEAAAALAALAYLLERKAWLLLPLDEPEPETEELMELPEPTTYEYMAAIESLRLWEEERSHKFFRPADVGPDPYEIPYEIGNVSVSDLAIAFEKVLRKAHPEPMAPLSKPRKSLTEMISVVLLSMTYEWRELGDIIARPYTRTDAVYWFLALLELTRLGQVHVRVMDGEVLFIRVGKAKVTGGVTAPDPE
jgi:segregation and condensation protein A